MYNSHLHTARVSLNLASPWVSCIGINGALVLRPHFRPYKQNLHFSIGKNSSIGKISKLTIEFEKHCFRVYKKECNCWEHALVQKLYSVQFSHSVVSNYLQPHGLQHARPPCPSPTPEVYSNSCPLSRWRHPTISSSVIPFSSCLQYFAAWGSFQMSHIFTSGDQIIGVSASASVLPMNIQDWSPSGWTGWISLQSKRLSRVFSNTTVQKHQFFGSQLSL